MQDCPCLARWSEKGHSNTNKPPRCVISLTTTPQRLPFIKDTLVQLTKQTIPVNQVYLHIPRVSKKTGQPYRVPMAYHQIPGLTIHYCKHDVGPLTKLWPTLELEHDPDTLIFLADDDEWYPPDFFNELYHQALQHPQCALGYRGVQVKPQWTHVNEASTQIDLLETYAGVCYRRGFFDIEKFPPPSDKSPCFTTDDLWIGHHVKRVMGVTLRTLDGVPMGQGAGSESSPSQPNNMVAHMDPLSEENMYAGNRNQECISCLTW